MTLTAIEMAAQCWCDPRVSDRVMDPELATVVAEKIEAAKREVFEAMREECKRYDYCGGREWCLISQGDDRLFYTCDFDVCPG